MKLTAISSNEEMMRELGRRIRETRIDMGMTQTEIAGKAGVTKRTISRIENGEDLTVSTLLNVLRALHLAQNVDALVPEAVIRPSVLMAGMKKKQRVGKAVRREAKARLWKWGDEK